MEIEWLKKRLEGPLPGVEAQKLMSSRLRTVPFNVPEGARPSAVLALLFHKAEILHLLLIKRVADGKVHSGQISFPGGKHDTGDKDLTATALREANEEVGIIPSDVEIIGSLTPLYIPVSNFHVYPYVGYLNKLPQYIISAREVESVIEVPVQQLLAAEHKITIDITSHVVEGVIKNVRAYKLFDNVIWGATAMIISELEFMLHQYRDSNVK